MSKHKSNRNLSFSDFLVQEGVITEEQLQQIFSARKISNKSLESTLLDLKFTSETQISQAHARFHGIAYFDLSNFRIPSGIAYMVPEHIVKIHTVFPIGREGRKLIIAMVEPSNIIALDDINLLTGFSCRPVASPKSQVLGVINGFYGGILREGISYVDFNEGKPIDAETVQEIEDIIFPLRETVLAGLKFAVNGWYLNLYDADFPLCQLKFFGAGKKWGLQMFTGKHNQCSGQHTLDMGYSEFSQLEEGIILGIQAFS